MEERRASVNHVSTSIVMGLWRRRNYLICGISLLWECGKYVLHSAGYQSAGIRIGFEHERILVLLRVPLLYRRTLLPVYLLEDVRGKITK